VLACWWGSPSSSKLLSASKLEGDPVRLRSRSLLAFCLLLPIALLVTDGEYGTFSGGHEGPRGFSNFSNKFRFVQGKPRTRSWWAHLLLSLPRYLLAAAVHTKLGVPLGCFVIAALFSLTTLSPWHTGMGSTKTGQGLSALAIPIARIFLLGADFALEHSAGPSDSPISIPPIPA